MSSQMKLISLAATVMFSAVSFAQAPASAPAGATGLCRDGSYWTGATKKGACHGHKGVQDWYAGTATPAGGTTAAPAAVAATATAPAASAPSAPATSKASSASAVQAPGGGAGQVWVNNASKVYHCPTDRWYGKTKSGAYMSEAQAIAQGNRADHGKACSK
jgi:hypothetical protein